MPPEGEDNVLFGALVLAEPLDELVEGSVRVKVDGSYVAEGMIPLLVRVVLREGCDGRELR